MGSYGIGMERILTAAVEQSNDANGFWLTSSIAPFDVVNPSAENISKYLYDETAKQLRQLANGARISSITVWESDTTFATYRP
jgi:prolyl-tRNA synthetase